MLEAIKQALSKVSINQESQRNEAIILQDHIGNRVELASSRKDIDELIKSAHQSFDILTKKTNSKNEMTGVS